MKHDFYNISLEHCTVSISSSGSGFILVIFHKVLYRIQDFKMAVTSFIYFFSLPVEFHYSFRKKQKRQTMKGRRLHSISPKCVNFLQTSFGQKNLSCKVRHSLKERVMFMCLIGKAQKETHYIYM